MIMFERTKRNTLPNIERPVAKEDVVFKIPSYLGAGNRSLGQCVRYVCRRTGNICGKRVDVLFRSSNGSCQINLPVGHQVSNKTFFCFFPTDFRSLNKLSTMSLLLFFLFSGSYSLIVHAALEAFTTPKL